MNILVIAPHPDDESIGLGGTLLLHHAQNHRVCVVFLTSGELGLKHLTHEQAWVIREAEARAAANILHITRVEFLRLPDWGVEESVDAAAPRLAGLLSAEQPDLIYTPHQDDEHPDHAASLPLLKAAMSLTPGLNPTRMAYEVWSPLSRFDHVEDITAVMADKLRAISEYRSQLAEFKYDRAATGLSAYRGTLAAKVDYAEVFQTLW